MKNMLLITFGTLVLCLSFACKKPDPAEPDPDTPAPIQFPITLKVYKIEIVDSLKVYIKTDWQTKQEIKQYHPAIVQNQIFDQIGEQVITKLNFESAEWSNYDPRQTNDRMRVSKNGENFDFTVTIGSNTSCHAKATGDYNDLAFNCQAFVIHRQTGEKYQNDYFRDTCSPNMALDCANGDTVAILNYKIHLKK